jgi:hypothetical protein
MDQFAKRMAISLPDGPEETRSSTNYHLVFFRVLLAVQTGDGVSKIQGPDSRVQEIQKACTYISTAIGDERKKRKDKGKQADKSNIRGYSSKRKDNSTRRTKEKGKEIKGKT